MFSGSPPYTLPLLKARITQLCLTLRPHGLWILLARILKWVVFRFSRGSSQPGIKPRSPALQAESLPVEPQGKPKNTGVRSLSLLQWIFPTQESNQGLLHFRWSITCITSWAIREALCLFWMWSYSLLKAHNFLPPTDQFWKDICDICREIIYSITALI